MHTQSHTGYSTYLHGLRRRNRQSVPKRRDKKIQTQGHNQKRIQFSEQGESLKSRIFNHSHNTAITFLCFRERKRKATKHPECLTQTKRINGRSRFQIISTKDGSVRDKCCFLLHILYRSYIGFDLLLEMETLFPTRNEASRATCSVHYRKLSPLYY